MDEPTSGLDSYTAYSLIKLLKNIATNENSTMLCTIHQPSSEVFFLFDSVIFMKDGRVFYQGPVPEIVPHFSKFDYHCPKNYNPSDFIMSLSQTIPVEEIEKKGMFIEAPAVLQESSVVSTKRLDKSAEFKLEQSFFRQVMMLSHREYVNTSRDTNSLIARFVSTIFLNLLFGLIFMRAGSRGNVSNDDFNTHFGAIAMVTISSMFGSAQPVMLAFPFERPMFLREYTSGTCK